MDTARQKIGKMGETVAAEYLQRKGFRLIERNYRKPWGEIDIIAERDGMIRFVEVKTVSREIGNADGSREMDYRPEELVDHRKLIKLARTADLYMESKNDRREHQIDVVGVILDVRRHKAQCRLFEQVL